MLLAREWHGEMDKPQIERAVSATDDVRALIGELDDALAADYPPEARHGLSLDGIFAPHVRFFIARLGTTAVGCGGVAFFGDYAEVKRMYVRAASRGRGIAQALLARVESEASSVGIRTMRLETGIRQPAAVRLYERAGYRPCDAFGDYVVMAPTAIATSLFYEKQLTGS